MTETPDPDRAAERARAALGDALAAAAKRALAEGVTPEELIEYAERRMATLRSAFEPTPTDDQLESDDSNDASLENGLDDTDDSG